VIETWIGPLFVPQPQPASRAARSWAAAALPWEREIAAFRPEPATPLEPPYPALKRAIDLILLPPEEIAAQRADPSLRRPEVVAALLALRPGHYRNSCSGATLAVDLAAALPASAASAQLRASLETRAWAALAESFQESGEWEHAERALIAGFRRVPDSRDAAAYAGLLLAYARQEREREAVERAFEAAAEASRLLHALGDSGEETDALLAALALTAGRRAEALAALDALGSGEAEDGQSPIGSLFDEIEECRRLGRPDVAERLVGWVRNAWCPSRSMADRLVVFGLLLAAQSDLYPAVAPVAELAALERAATDPRDRIVFAVATAAIAASEGDPARLLALVDRLLAATLPPVWSTLYLVVAEIVEWAETDRLPAEVVRHLLALAGEAASRPRDFGPDFPGNPIDPD